MSEERDDMAEQAEMGDEALDRALAGAFQAHPFDAKLAARISAAARRTPVARMVEGPKVADRQPASARVNARTFAIAAGLVVAVGVAVHLFSGADSVPEHHAAAVEVASLTVDADAGALVIRPGDSGYAPPGRRVTLHEGDRVRAERRSVAIAFADGSEVRIRAETTVELRADRVALVGAGELYAAVTPRAAAEPKFHVEMPDGVEVAVVGTKFGVRYDGSAIFATVAEGTIQMQLRSEGTPALTQRARKPFEPARAGAGEQLSLTLASAAPMRHAVDVEAALSWALGSSGRHTQPPVVEPMRVPVFVPRPAAPSTEPTPPTSGGDLPIDGPALPPSNDR